MENNMEVPQKTKNKVAMPYDPAILHLGIYPCKTIIQKDTCTPILTAALFLTVKNSQNIETA